MPRKKEVEFCENHPEVAASAACQICGKKICYNCTIDLFGASLCSARCAVLYIIKNLAAGLFILAEFLLRTIFRPLRWFLSATPRAAVSIILGTGLIVCLFFIYQLNHELGLLRELEAGGSPAAAVDTVGGIPPRVQSPAPGGTVLSNTISVEGEAEENHVVALLVNGKLHSVQVPEKGRFTFSNVKVTRGENLLEVRSINPETGISSLERMHIDYSLPAVSYLARDFQRGSLTRKEVALTFDGGGENNAAAEILDILKEKGVHSTFFLTGEFIRRFPATVRRITREGHEVGNHTWNHPHLTTYAENRRQRTLKGIDAVMISNELQKTAELYKAVTNREMAHLWRAPYGEFNSEILRWAAAAGYRHVGWTVGRGWENTMDSMDWVADTTSSIYHSADEIVEKIINFGAKEPNGASGAVVLMHLGTNRTNDFPHRRLGDIIDTLREKGYRLVTVSTMMR